MRDTVATAPHRAQLRCMSIGRRLERGLWAGAVATTAMSGVMALARHWGLLGQPPPRIITRRLLKRLRLHRGEPLESMATALAHFGFGMGAGALYAALSPDLRAKSARRAAGLLFGTAVWGLSYAGWLPKLRLMPPVALDRPGRQPSMVAAHWLYGWVLSEALEQR